MDRHSPAQRWAAFEQLKTMRPFLRYVASPDPDTPAKARECHNLVLPVDHPFWLALTRRRAFGKGWTLQSLSERDIARLQMEGEQLMFSPPT